VDGAEAVGGIDGRIVASVGDGMAGKDFVIEGKHGGGYACVNVIGGETWQEGTPSPEYPRRIWAWGDRRIY
jgi:hypothetical protein